MEPPAASLPLTVWTTWFVKVLGQKGTGLWKLTGVSVVVGGKCLASTDSSDAVHLHLLLSLFDSLYGSGLWYVTSKSKSSNSHAVYTQPV